MALFARKETKLAVEVPSPAQDRALTSKVGIVAIVGFGLGVLWPRILDLKVGPDVPGASKPRPSKPVVAPPAGSASAATPSESAAVADDGPAEDAAALTNKQTVIIADGRLESCRNKKGDKLDDCGKLKFDKIAKSKLGELVRCPAAIGLEGDIALSLTINFEKSEVVVDGEKKTSSLPGDTIRGVSKCAAKELKDVELDKVSHTHHRYTVVYDLSFYPPGKAPPAPEEGKPASDSEEEEGLGRATVTWEKALLRDSPEQGKIVVRLRQGTRVKLLEQKDDWFLVEASKGKKGWVYGQAIGK